MQIKTGPIHPGPEGPGTLGPHQVVTVADGAFTEWAVKVTGEHGEHIIEYGADEAKARAYVEATRRNVSQFRTHLLYRIVGAWRPGVTPSVPPSPDAAP